MRMPVLFLGHGNPMHAVTEDAFSKTLGELGARLPAPKAILCISAHWLTQGTFVTHVAQPKTIHDFFGFPKPLFEVQYKAPGSPELAERIYSQISKPGFEIQLDEQWGLDHGAWAVLRHLYPQANVPVVQLSIDTEQSLSFHYKLGMELRKLRDEGVLIVGSGNIVHNLRQIKWEPNPPASDWAVSFDEWVKSRLLARDFAALASDDLWNDVGESARMSVPSWDHWIPILYALGASDEGDSLEFVYDAIENGSIAMRSLVLGAGAKV